MSGVEGGVSLFFLPCLLSPFSLFSLSVSSKFLLRLRAAQSRAEQSQEPRKEHARTPGAALLILSTATCSHSLPAATFLLARTTGITSLFSSSPHHATTHLAVKRLLVIVNSLRNSPKVDHVVCALRGHARILVVENGRFLWGWGVESRQVG